MEREGYKICLLSSQDDVGSDEDLLGSFLNQPDPSKAYSFFVFFTHTPSPPAPPLFSFRFSVLTAEQMNGLFGTVMIKIVSRERFVPIYHCSKCIVTK